MGLRINRRPATVVQADTGDHTVLIPTEDRRLEVEVPPLVQLAMKPGGHLAQRLQRCRIFLCQTFGQPQSVNKCRLTANQSRTAPACGKAL